MKKSVENGRSGGHSLSSPEPILYEMLAFFGLFLVSVFFFFARY